MKKIFVILVFLFSLSGIFAASSSSSSSSSSDSSNSTLSVGVAFPYMKHDYKISGEDSVTLFGPGVNLNYRHQNDGFTYGFFLDSDIYLPAYKTVNISETESTTKNFSDYDYFFGIDALAGVYKVVYSSDGVTVPVGIGIHLDGYTSKLTESSYSIKESVYTMGLGCWANCEINLSEKFGAFAGIKFVYDFYYKMKNSGTLSESNSGSCNAFSVVPAVGVAYHF